MNCDELRFFFFFSQTKAVFNILYFSLFANIQMPVIASVRLTVKCNLEM